MQKKYWLGRAADARAKARLASSSRARLVHYELAGRYSVNAAHCGDFLFGAASSDGERAALGAPIQ